MINLSPTQIWKTSLAELELQMTKATFNTWLKDASLVYPSEDEPLNGRIVVAVRNDYAKAWLQNRLGGTIKDTLKAIAGRPLEVEFVVLGEKVNGVPTAPDLGPVEGYKRPHTPTNGQYGGNLPPDERQALLTKLGEEDEQPEEPPKHTFPGFEPLDSNWTQTPDSFYTYVIPNAHGVVVKLVATVIHQTLGHFEDKKRNHRRDEWPVNNAVVQRMAGIHSKTSFQTALWDARADGYIIQRPLDDVADAEEKAKLSKKMGYTVHYTLRLRYPDDPIDTPTEARPNYGNKQR